MSHLHMAPFVSVIRIYDEPDGYEKRARYKATVTVTHMSDDTVFLSGAVNEEFSPEMVTAVFAFLKSKGMVNIHMERRRVIRKRSL